MLEVLIEKRSLPRKKLLVTAKKTWYSFKHQKLIGSMLGIYQYNVNGFLDFYFDEQMVDSIVIY